MKMLRTRALPGVRRQKKSVLKKLARSWQLYVILLLPLIYLLIFKYYPMLGAQIAFKDYKANLGIWQSPWVGMKHFIRFFSTYDFWMLLKNTVSISLLSLLFGFPLPIVLALCLNACRSIRFKKTVQMVTYAPYFISTVVIVGMLSSFLAPRTGIINNAIAALGFERVNFMGEPSFFKPIYILSNIWQSSGYGAIVYIAALASVDPSLHEAAVVDGANRFQRVWHIDLACITPIIVTMLILNTGQILDVGFEKILLMQNMQNISASEVISTYVYKTGVASASPNFSYPTAIGLFTSVINLIVILCANRAARRIGDVGFW